jgi:hypothetical protein
MENVKKDWPLGQEIDQANLLFAERWSIRKKPPDKICY